MPKEKKETFNENTFSFFSSLASLEPQELVESLNCFNNNTFQVFTC